MTQWEQFRERLLANPETRREYERLRPQYEIVLDAIRYRQLRGLSQEQLAQKMGKQQPAIARFEAARTAPSFSFLQDLAEALGLNLVVRLESKPVEAPGARGVARRSDRRRPPEPTSRPSLTYWLLNYVYARQAPQHRRPL
jgi:transcriptional regulator with XRE-family HTH domain